MEKVNLNEKFALIDERWRPKIVGELNDQEVKLVKVKGVFPWHRHDIADELFMTVKGVFRIEFRDKIIELKAGEFCIVPHGIEHRTAADEEAEILIFEPKNVLNTGNVKDAQFTAPMGDKI